MSTLTRLRAVLNELSQLVGGEKGELIATLADLFEEQFVKQNNTAAQIMANIELGLSNHLQLLQKEVADLKVLMVERQRNASVRDEVVSGKLHTLSNFIVSLEGKIDEIVQMLTNADDE